MKTSLLFISGLLSIVILGGCASSSERQQSPNRQQSESSAAGITWHTYTNQNMGFSMKLPEKAYAGGADGIAPIVVLEDLQTGDLYVTLEYYYDQRNDEPANAKHKKILTLNFLKTNPLITPLYWHVQSVVLNDNQHIDQWIKKTFGKGCSLGKQKATDQKDVIELSIQSDGKPLDTTACPVNYGVFMRYSKTKHQLVFWNLGQTPAFFNDVNGQPIYDFDILKSFRFQ